MHSVMNLDTQAEAPQGGAMRLNITVLIVVTTVVSTICSVAGGVWLYFKSVESLEGAVVHSSNIEVAKLKGEILLTYDEVLAANRELSDLFMPAEDYIIESPVAIERNATTDWLEVPTSATEEWAKIIRWKAWSRIKNSKVLQGMGIVLVPWVREDPTGQYTQIWYDLKADASREYVFARYGQDLAAAYDPTADPWKEPLVFVDALNANNGTVTHYVYNYSFNTFTWTATYGFAYDGDFSKYTNDTYPSDTFVHGEDGAVLQRFRAPKPWYASDKNPYVFQAFDVGYAPPAAPHPWSGYKQVWVQTYFVFNSWEDTIVDYASANKDTTVMIYDQTTDIVYASTTGTKMINEACWAADLHGNSGKDITGCVSHIINMTNVEQAAWRSAAGARASRAASVFWKTSLGGSGYFMRHAQLFTFVPADGTPAIDSAILWFQTTNSVQKKIHSALVVFICFACTVFVFDVCMALLEIYLIAMPLSRIAGSLGNLNTFDPDEVMSVVKGVTQSSCLSVKEVYGVAQGLDMACAALLDYKAFLPSTLFTNDDHVVEPPSGEVALVFTDIVQSTELWSRSAMAMNTAMEMHNDIMRGALSKHRGYEVKTIGDAFMVAFANPLNALKFCFEVQGDLAAQEWPNDLCLGPDGMKVRMGCHFGHTIPEENPLTGRRDYRGPAVNLAARSEGMALPGTVCVTAEVLDVVQGDAHGYDELNNPEVDDLGMQELKGIEGMQHLYLLVPSQFEVRLGQTQPGAPYEMPQACDHSSTSSGPNSGVGGKKTSLALVRGNATVVVCLIMGLRNSDIFEDCNAMVRAAVDAAAQTDGVLKNVTGQTLVAVWNGSKPCKMHTSSAMRFAAQLDVRSSIMRLGISTGQLMFGNVGTQKRRFNTAFGRPLEVAHAAAALAARYGTFALFADVTPDCSASASAAVTPFIRLIDVWEMEECSRKVWLYELFCKKLMRQLEEGWGMLSESSGDSDVDVYNSLFRSALKGDSIALDKIRLLAAMDDGDSVLPRVVRMMEALPDEDCDRSARVTVRFCSVPAGVLDYETTVRCGDS
eukprot:TRINITY_DN2136_c0_g1_i1.p1 TRINITY_DN2136_c0_g1~~TRINITY_DN2136_c0_g1_i1.p1  ORF type:complete len:1060 (+),score=291.67 TRINITY_DN2136_c0_g1_i1:39-3182(+)